MLGTIDDNRHTVMKFQNTVTKLILIHGGKQNHLCMCVHIHKNSFREGCGSIFSYTQSLVTLSVPLTPNYRITQLFLHPSK